MFEMIDELVETALRETPLVVVDVHAEATSEKVALARWLDGKATAVFGTHTHVPTADEQILPGGTAFISDVGMTGPYDSILGRQVERVLSTAVTFVPAAFDVAENDPRLGGAIVELDSATGQATSIRRLMLTESAVNAMQASTTQRTD